MATSPAAGRSSRPLANSSILWPTSCSHAPSLPTAAAETGSRTAALLAIPAVLIILREIFASALRGWTASVGESSLTTVGIWGKLKPAFTLFSLTGLLATCRTHSDGVFRVSLYLLYSTRHGARLSVGSYVKAALPAFIARSQHPKGEKSVELLPLTFRSGLGFSEEDAELEKLRCRNVRVQSSTVGRLPCSALFAMGPGDQSVYVLPAITGRCLEVLPRPIKLQRSLRGRLSRSRPVAKTCFSKDEDAPKSEVDLEVPDASPIQRSASSVLPLTDSWSTPSLSESSERTPSLRPFSASSHRDVHGTRHLGLGPLEAAGEDRLAMSAKDAKRRRRVRRATTKTVERSADSKTSSLREAKLKLFYVVQFGNNSGLIRDLLKHRRIWFPGPGDPGYLGRRQEAPCTMKLETAADAPEIQLLWSQYVVRDFLDAMAEEQEGWIVSYNDETKIRLERRETAAGPVGVRAHNHFEKNALISSKAGLRETMVGYYTSHSRDPFGAIPLTFVVRTGSGDPEFVRWLESFEELRARKESVWLVKPGDKANQGKGIVICDSVEEVRDAIDSKSRSWVIQKYIEKPFLIHKRKFDIRSYCLLAQDPEGVLHGYFYRQAYLRTTSSNFTLATKDRFVHLNNDAVQKHGDSYGKFEAANKMSLSEFQSYLDAHHGRDCLSIHSGLLPQMKALMADTLRAVGTKINPRGIQHCFEVFGFDFMVDEHFRVWLIEVNTNPSLDPCCSLLLSMIPKMLDEALSLSLDKIFGDAKAAGHTAWERLLVLWSRSTTPKNGWRRFVASGYHCCQRQEAVNVNCLLAAFPADLPV
eukprot:s829_g20.t2